MTRFDPGKKFKLKQKLHTVNTISRLGLHMVPNRRTEEKKRERGVEIRPLFLSFSLQFFGSEPYAALLVVVPSRLLDLLVWL